MHDVIQVEQKCTTCRQKRYTCILLTHLIWLTLFKTCSVTYACHQFPIWRISCQKSGKNVWKWTKKHSIFSIWAYSSKLVDMQKLGDSLRGYHELVFFRLICWFKKNKTQHYLMRIVLRATKSQCSSFSMSTTPQGYFRPRVLLISGPTGYSRIVLEPTTAKGTRL